MSKYWQLLKITFQEYFVYRLNFFLWRFRSFIFFITLFFFWLAVYQEKEAIFGYQKPQMFSYLVGVAFLRGIVLGSHSVDEAVGAIRSGRIANWLLKPVDIIKSMFSKDLATKSLNFIFCFFEIALVYMIFRFPFYFAHNSSSILFFILSSLLSIFLYFYILIFFAGLSFWIDQIWAVRWLFLIILLEFFSGTIFPLDVLPSGFLRIIRLTPFPYLVYFPLKIWLEQVTSLEILKVLGITSAWLFFFKKAAGWLWQRGLRSYSAWGG